MEVEERRKAMICPKCGKLAVVETVYDRDTDVTRRRYVCEECEPRVVINTEEVMLSFGEIQRRKLQHEKKISTPHNR
jgi:transcriptional regulator NrdR family protein